MKKQKKKKKLKKKRIRNNQKRKQTKNNNKSYNGLRDNLFNGKSYESISKTAHFDTLNQKNREQGGEEEIPKATSNDIKIMKGKMRKSLFSDKVIKRYCGYENKFWEMMYQFQMFVELNWDKNFKSVLTDCEDDKIYFIESMRKCLSLNGEELPKTLWLMVMGVLIDIKPIKDFFIRLQYLEQTTIQTRYNPTLGQNVREIRLG